VGGGDRRDGLGDAQALDREIGQQLRPVELGGQGELELTEHMQRGGEGDSAVGQATVGQATVDQAAGSTKLGPRVPVQLDALGKDSGVRAFALHPGGILTPLQRHLPREEMVGLGWIDEDGNPLNPGFKSPEQGAATEVWAATSPQLDGLGGVFCEDCDVAEVSTDKQDELHLMQHLHPAARPAFALVTH